MRKMMINGHYITQDIAVNLVCNHFSVQQTDIIGAGRTKNVAMARCILTYILHNFCGLSATEIANLLKRSRRQIFAYNAKTTFLIIRDKEWRTAINNILGADMREESIC